jgi:hypothetical protein
MVGLGQERPNNSSISLSGSQRMRAMAIGVQLHFYPRESEEIARVVCIFLALLPKSVM